VLFFIDVMGISADTSFPSKKITAYSQNSEYMLIVYPTAIPNNFFSYKYQRQRRRGMVKDTIIPCHAVLYHICNSDTVKLWDKPLINTDSPVYAIVANDGKSIITIDDWGRRGYQHTLVIYGENGELIEDFELKDISPFPLEHYVHTISSINWRENREDRENVKYLDKDRIEIHFIYRKGEDKIRVFNIKTREFEEP